jgi:hypothetical protein
MNLPSWPGMKTVFSWTVNCRPDDTKLTIIKLVFWEKFAKPEIPLHTVYLFGWTIKGLAFVTLFSFRDISILQARAETSNWLKGFHYHHPVLTLIYRPHWTQLFWILTFAPVNSFPSAEAMHLSPDNEQPSIWFAKSFPWYANISGWPSFPMVYIL